MTTLPSLANEACLFVGTYTQKDRSLGIYRATLNLKTGALSNPELATETGNPTFLALHPKGRVLYAVDELGVNSEEKPTGLVSAFGVDPQTAQLTFLNAQPVADGGPGPCHVTVETSGRVLLVANYGGGSVAAFPLQADGRIGPRSALETHNGPLGPLKDRQDSPHAHCVALAPDRSRVYVADLGLDRLYAYSVDPNHATLIAQEPPFTPLKAGSGPRHVAFSRDGKFIYVVNELASTVALFEHDSGTGLLSPRQIIPTIPESVAGKNTASELRLHPNGRFLYASNRGHDSLAIYSRDLDSGTLSLVEIVPCGGKGPRDFSLSPDGAWLVCAHQDSHSLTSFAVDASTGKLTPSNALISLDSPVCVLFASTAKLE